MSRSAGSLCPAGRRPSEICFLIRRAMTSDTRSARPEVANIQAFSRTTPGTSTLLRTQGRIVPRRGDDGIGQRDDEVRALQAGVALEIADLVVRLERRERQAARELRDAANLPVADQRSHEAGFMLAERQHVDAVHDEGVA